MGTHTRRAGSQEVAKSGMLLPQVVSSGIIGSPSGQGLSDTAPSPRSPTTECCSILTRRLSGP